MREGIGEGQGPGTHIGGKEQLHTALLLSGWTHTLTVMDVHVAPGIGSSLTWLASKASAGVFHSCCVLGVAAETARIRGKEHAHHWWL